MRRAAPYQVTLTVTDSNGQTGATTKTVTVGSTVISDSFTRTGRAVGDRPRSAARGTPTRPSAFAVTNGQGTVTMSAPGCGSDRDAGQRLAGEPEPAVRQRNQQGGDRERRLLHAEARRTANGDYRFKVLYLADGTVHLIVSKDMAGSGETIIQEVAVPDLTYTVGTMMRARVLISGSGTTTIAGRVWTVGSTEPTANQISVTDCEIGLQGAGSMDLLAYLSGSSTNAPLNALVDNLSATSSRPLCRPRTSRSARPSSA